jgi:hypothetical protein
MSVATPFYVHTSALQELAVRKIGIEMHISADLDPAVPRHLTLDWLVIKAAHKPTQAHKPRPEQVLPLFIYEKTCKGRSDAVCSEVFCQSYDVIELKPVISFSFSRFCLSQECVSGSLLRFISIASLSLSLHVCSYMGRGSRR